MKKGLGETMFYLVLFTVVAALMVFVWARYRTTADPQATAAAGRSSTPQSQPRADEKTAQAPTGDPEITEADFQPSAPVVVPPATTCSFFGLWCTATPKKVRTTSLAEAFADARWVMTEVSHSLTVDTVDRSTSCRALKRLVNELTWQQSKVIKPKLLPPLRNLLAKTVRIYGRLCVDERSHQDLDLLVDEWESIEAALQAFINEVELDN